MTFAIPQWPCGLRPGRVPKEAAVRAGHSSVSFTLDRYGHLYPESDAGLRDRLDTFFTEGQAVEGIVMALPARTPPQSRQDDVHRLMFCLEAPPRTTELRGSW